MNCISNCSGNLFEKHTHFGVINLWYYSVDGLIVEVGGQGIQNNSLKVLFQKHLLIFVHVIQTLRGVVLTTYPSANLSDSYYLNLIYTIHDL